MILATDGTGMARATIFTDRHDAGRRLAAELPEFDPAQTVVLALPRGGVPVAEEICRARGLPLDLLMVRKIGMPGQPELAAGAVADGPHPITVVNSRIAGAYGLDDARVEAMGRDLLPEIARRRALYLGDRARPEIAGKTVVLVDDGAATGATLRVGLLAARKAGAKRLILALPVAAPDVLEELSRLADVAICLDTPRMFRAVGGSYATFSQVSDAEVVAAMARCAGDGSADAG
ncbi:phosphoribosyltransferase [Jannaschia ovalis]|uniref:Phosphoribosyltransferase family protein n=1 Tax=Jannaschia ovalis TaxID=3038773 RepID=A0ABY8L732_9RHOB|nr:phosphoribosyltransferase family protein [Jannaschia sp. GRR-S6-38]WGH77182.1 phosphoribosyltransferase family protein [Jannaschia sp. GRR-S6-38]